MKKVIDKTLAALKASLLKLVIINDSVLIILFFWFITSIKSEVFKRIEPVIPYFWGFIALTFGIAGIKEFFYKNDK